MLPGHVGKESKEVKESYHSYPKHPAVSINVFSNFNPSIICDLAYEVLPTCV